MFGERLAKHLASVKHGIDSLNFIVAGDTIAAGGKEWGVTQGGIRWPHGAVSQGLFCNVFECDGLLIRRTSMTCQQPDYGEMIRIEVEGAPEAVLNLLYSAQERRG